MFFRIAISTRRMLSNCVGIDQLCVDATYKLVWQGFPFLVVGTVDRAKKFHPLCFAICSNERQEDFTFLFKTIKSSVEELYNEIFAPSILIADGAYSIRNAFEEVFGDSMQVMIMCYAHVLRNVSKQSLKNPKNKPKILDDIAKMNLAPSKKVFKMLSKLLLKKWRKTEPKFAEYFETQWLNSHCNWYEAAAIYSPSTNNALEGIRSHDHR